MEFILNTLRVFIISTILINCGTLKKNSFQSDIIYKSENLIITQIAENSFVHTSFKQTNDFGNVPCNGLIVRNNKETIIFDTPTNDKTSEELLQWIKGTLHCKINAILPTHFHDDCLGGLKAFDQNEIPSFANIKTLELAKTNNFVVPKNSFTDSLVLKVGKEQIIAKYFGEGHTKDNIVGYFAADNILFGGCLIKELNASKGYLGDANLDDWSTTVEKVKKGFPNLKIVVPGHGTHGSKKLLDYTIQLFKKTDK